MITINKEKYYILKSKNGKCYGILLTSTKSKCKKPKKTCSKKSKCTKCQQKCLKKCLKKCKKKSLTNYHLIKIPVPKPAGISGLPKYIYFRIDNSFTDKQEERIIDGMTTMLAVWKQHYNEKWNGGTNNGTSRLAACTNTYAKKNLKPVWYRGKAITNGRKATNVAMDQLTQLIKDNGFKRSCPAKIKAGKRGTIYASTASTPFKAPLSIKVNPKQLDNPQLNISLLSGSLFHAWLHRAGFHHPKTTSYFIAECPMCIMRGNKGKSDGTPDIFYIRFFD